MKKKINKKLEDFIKDETGKVSKDKLLKVGLGTIGALSALSSFSSAFAQPDHTSYASTYSDDVVNECAPMNAVDHQSHVSY